jgi:hypothetical protein
VVRVLVGVDSDDLHLLRARAVWFEVYTEANKGITGQAEGVCGLGAWSGCADQGVIWIRSLRLCAALGMLYNMHNGEGVQFQLRSGLLINRSVCCLLSAWQFACLYSVRALRMVRDAAPKSPRFKGYSQTWSAQGARIYLWHVWSTKVK